MQWGCEAWRVCETILWGEPATPTFPHLAPEITP